MSVPAARLASAVLAALVLVLVLAACGPIAPPSPSTSPTDEALVLPPPAAAQVVACVSINPAECTFTAGRILARLPGEDGEPFSILIRLGQCFDEAATCPESLSARQGTALVEYPDGGKALMFHLGGPAGAPSIEPIDEQVFTDPIQPGSPPVEDPGPWAFEVGHCGLLHAVDFDGAFWVLVGHVPDPEHQALFGSETGSIGFLGPDRARYVGTQQRAFELARFPGAKRFQLCD